MNRTAWIVLAAAVTLLLTAVLVPWLFANDRYKVRNDVTVVWNGKPVKPLACLTGAAAPFPFPGLELILPGDLPRVRLVRAHDGKFGEVGLDRSGRLERLLPAACTATTFSINGNGRTSYNVEGVEGEVDVSCQLKDLNFSVNGSFANCFRPD
jgi:hypothetical protein